MKILIVGQFACSDSYTECSTFDLHHFNVNIKAFPIMPSFSNYGAIQVYMYIIISLSCYRKEILLLLKQQREDIMTLYNCY